MKAHADVAQLVEHHLAKVRVASSNLVVRSKKIAGQPRLRPGLTAFWRPIKPIPAHQLPARRTDQDRVRGSIRERRPGR